MRKAFILAVVLAVLAGLGVYLAASVAETFGWGGLKAHLLGLGTGAFVILYVVGGAADLFLRSSWGGRARR